MMIYNTVVHMLTLIHRINLIQMGQLLVVGPTSLPLIIHTFARERGRTIK